VKIGTDVPYLMVEARLMADQFDAGIPKEGVIVYEVQTPDSLGHRVNHLRPLILKTPQALAVGQAFVSDNGVDISITGAIPGGFSVVVDYHGWHYTDATADAGAPGAAGDPSGYMFDAQGTQHVVYRGGDGHIHELYWG
jgi:hypothetical protein